MTPARTNQNWLPGIFNEILGDNWLAERRSLLEAREDARKKGIEMLRRVPI